MKNMIDEILQRENQLKSQIEDTKIKAEQMKKEEDKHSFDIINQTIEEAKKEAETLIVNAKKETTVMEKEKLKEVDESKQFDISEKRFIEVADKIISQYFLKEN